MNGSAQNAAAIRLTGEKSEKVQMPFLLSSSFPPTPAAEQNASFRTFGNRRQGITRICQDRTLQHCFFVDTFYYISYQMLQATKFGNGFLALVNSIRKPEVEEEEEEEAWDCLCVSRNIQSASPLPLLYLFCRGGGSHISQPSSREEKIAGRSAKFYCYYVYWWGEGKACCCVRPSVSQKRRQTGGVQASLTSWLFYTEQKGNFPALERGREERRGRVEGNHDA